MPPAALRRWLQPFRPVLLPAWNGAHHLARRLGDYAGAVRHRRFERCAVCGRFGPMLYRRRVIPPLLAEWWGLTPDLADALARKESCDCAVCGAKLRTRRLAAVLLELYPVGSPPRPAPSVRAWARSGEARRLAVAEINRIDGLHETLSTLPGLSSSDYHDPAAPGVFDPSARHEDLTRLSYPDAAFDLVLTSETLEHVPDLHAALAEIRRVLRPGGRHLFTVPLLPGVPRTFPRARLAPDGTIETLHPPLLHHPGGDHGYPVFHEFGADLPDLLRAAGFEAELRHGPPRPDDIAQVFVTLRSDPPAEPPP